jgi:hypothetical protein
MHERRAKALARSLLQRKRVKKCGQAEFVNFFTSSGEKPKGLRISSGKFGEDSGGGRRGDTQGVQGGDRVTGGL